MESGSALEERINDIERGKKLREEGKYQLIPFYESFPKLSTIVPGVLKGVNYLICANSGVGKTLFTKCLFFLTPLRFVRDHPESGIKLKILFFLLEESKEEFIDSLICWVLYEKHKLLVDSQHLKSYFKDPISDELMNQIKEAKLEVEDLLQYVELHDNVYNPTGIYKACRTYSEKVGTHMRGEKEHITSNEKGEKVVTKYIGYLGYKPNDENEIVIVVLDNVNLLQEESGLSKREAISKWSMEYARSQITKNWKWAVVNVQQLASLAEQQQFTLMGDSIESKLEPSLDGLGDVKTTQRDQFVILGVFAPYRYGIKTHLGYDITKLKDNYRSISILKNRLGKSNIKIPMFFSGANMHFEELPVLKSTEEYNNFLLKKGIN